MSQAFFYPHIEYFGGFAFQEFYREAAPRRGRCSRRGLSTDTPRWSEAASLARNERAAFFQRVILAG